MTQPDLSWWRHAACQGMNLNLFYPAGTTGPWTQHINQAKTVCNRCPVRPECLQYAREKNIKTGIWGGLTADERAGTPRHWQRHNTEQKETTHNGPG